MSFLDRLRNWLSGPPHIEARGDDDAAALHEEYHTPDEGEAELRRMEQTADRTTIPSYSAAEGAEAGEAEIESEEAPPDPDP
jgi:hypothetical protein